MYRHSDDRFVQALAFAAHITMDHFRIDKGKKDRMVREMVDNLMEDTFDVSDLTSKIGMKAIIHFDGVKNLKGNSKHSKKMMHVNKCILRLTKMVDVSYIDLKFAWDMAKINGHFLPNISLAHAAKDKIIHDAIAGNSATMKSKRIRLTKEAQNSFKNS